jgi:hypothetical protein
VNMLAQMAADKAKKEAELNQLFEEYISALREMHEAEMRDSGLHISFPVNVSFARVKYVHAMRWGRYE